MPTFWFNPTDLVTGDPQLRIIANPSGSDITTTSAGTFWVSLGATLPFPAQIESVVVCYQIAMTAMPPSAIERTRLRALTAPGAEVVLLDDPTIRASRTSVCFEEKVDRKAPDAALELGLRLHFQNMADQIVLGALGLRVTELCANRRSLGEFGDYGTPDKASATLDRALEAMAKQGGGVLCVPRDAPATFFPRNSRQERVDSPAVTVLDFRTGYERHFVPPSGTLSTSGSRAGHLIERDLAVDLDWAGQDSTALIQSRYRGGASSYEQELSKPCPAAVGRKRSMSPPCAAYSTGRR